MVPGEQILILWKSRKSSQLLSHLSRFILPQKALIHWSIYLLPRMHVDSCPLFTTTLKCTNNTLCWSFLKLKKIDIKDSSNISYSLCFPYNLIVTWSRYTVIWIWVDLLQFVNKSMSFLQLSYKRNMTSLPGTFVIFSIGIKIPCWKLITHSYINAIEKHLRLCSILVASINYQTLKWRREPL